jgi:hypothetical protein
MGNSISRRQFLELCAIGCGALFLSACQQVVSVVTPTETPALENTSIPTLPAITSTPGPTATPGPKAMVAIGKADRYDHDLIRAELERMFDGLGGLGDVVKPGAKVGIKVNMTGAYFQDGYTDPRLPNTLPRTRQWWALWVNF